MKHARTAVATSIGVGLLAAGCGSSGVSTTPAKTTPTTPTPAQTAQKAGVGSTIDLSDSLNGNRVAVTVVKVANPDSGTDQLTTPSPGDKLESIEYRVVNTGSNTYSDSPLNAITAKDAAGQNVQQVIAASTVAGAQLPSSVNLAPGDTTLGYVTFSVPAGDQIAQTQYTVNLGISGGTGEWQVGGGQPATPTPAQPQTPASPQSPAASSTQAVVEEYYAAINSGNYALAWSLGGMNIEHGSYDTFVQGFAGTSSDAVTVVSVNGDTANVQITATQTDGSQQHFSGTYTVQNGVIVAADIH